MRFTYLLAIGNAVATRGVSPENEKYYVPDADGMFSCISDPSVKIPFSQVNDDYCDCPDGSDEPGTSACTNGRFYCENKGHVPSFISARYVNDGKCDYEMCCDGSDEAPGLCPNKCAEVHERVENEKKAARDTLNKGLAAREQLVHKAAEVRSQLSKEIEEKTKELEAAKLRLKEAEQRAADLSNAPDEVDEELEAKFELSRGAVKEAYKAVDDLKRRLAERSEAYDKLFKILETMKNDYNPNFNDAAVKQAIQNWQEMASNQVKNIEDTSIKGVDEVVGYIDALYPKGGANAQTGLWQDLKNSLRTWLVNQRVLPPSAAPKQHSKSHKDAEDAVNTLKKEVQKIETDIEKKQQDLKSENGPQDVFRALKDVCVKNRYGEYDYEVCFYGKITQTGNGQNTKLGVFNGKIEVGLDSIRLGFTNGAKCWEGPVRSVDVTVRCGVEDRVIKVAEPEKCIYSLDMLSPAACIPPSNPEKEAGPVKDEL